MMGFVAYCILSGINLVFAYTSLLTKRLKAWQYGAVFLSLSLFCFFREAEARSWETMLIMALHVLVILIWVKEHILWNLCFACLGYLLVVLGSHLCSFLYGKLFGFYGGNMTFEQTILYTAVFVAIAGIGLLGIRYLLYQRLDIRKYFQIPRVIKTGICCQTLLFSLLFVANVVQGDHVGYDAKILGFNGFVFGVSMVISLILLLFCSNVIKKEQENKYIQDKNQMLADYVKELDRITMEWRMFRHDYKNMMCTAEGFLREGKYEELKTFWKREFTGLNEETDSQRRWENLSGIVPLEIRGIFYEKMVRGLSMGIQVRVEVPEQVSIGGMPVLELSRVLGVYLDNALEAATETEQPEMCIGIHKTEKGCRIRIENTVKNPVDLTRLGEKGFSTKGKSGRGIGLYSVKQILERHENVYVQTRVEEDRFIQEMDIVM